MKGHRFRLPQAPSERRARRPSWPDRCFRDVWLESLCLLSSVPTVDSSFRARQSLIDVPIAASKGPNFLSRFCRLPHVKLQRDR